jgi:hypothetical protein
MKEISHYSGSLFLHYVRIPSFCVCVCVCVCVCACVKIIPKIAGHKSTRLLGKIRKTEKGKVAEKHVSSVVILSLPRMTHYSATCYVSD